MQKILYICKNNSIFKYNVFFEEREILKKLNDILNYKLEDCSYEDKNIVCKIKNYSYIKNSFDLVIFLRKILLEDDIIDLSEIRNLIMSINSPMRSPQTLMAISNIFSSFDYQFIDKEIIENYQLLIKVTCRNGLMNDIDKNNDILDIATKNQMVLNNLKIKLPIETKKIVKSITM